MSVGKKISSPARHSIPVINIGKCVASSFSLSVWQIKSESRLGQTWACAHFNKTSKDLRRALKKFRFVKVSASFCSTSKIYLSIGRLGLKFYFPFYNYYSVRMLKVLYRCEIILIILFEKGNLWWLVWYVIIFLFSVRLSWCLISRGK